MCTDSIQTDRIRTNATLDLYVSRNLTQNKYIFGLSTIVITFGFGIIIWGIFQSINNPSQITIPIAATVSGTVTEFIGATFIFIYRSTIEQAKEYYKTLERRILVDLAVEILETVDNQAMADNLKSSAKVSLAKTIIELSGK